MGVMDKPSELPEPIRARSSKTVYENAWMRVREEEIERADGSQGIYGVVEKPDFALIIPQDADGGFWLVEQYRYPVSSRYWEFPQGSWEHQADADPAELARGELREETGLRAGTMEHLGHLFEAYGFSNQGFDVWLAADLEEAEASRHVEEQDMLARKISRVEWEAMRRDGTIKDAPSIAAYGLLLVNERADPASRY
jgi:8-oxo-dGTP pyrophosphatase MutT (NUDIX family)